VLNPIISKKCKYLAPVPDTGLVGEDHGRGPDGPGGPGGRARPGAPVELQASRVLAWAELIDCYSEETRTEENLTDQDQYL
jgi:hypothetical protein